MAQHPLNLAFRFLLELCILAALAYWGWTRWRGAARVLVAVVAPLIAALLWGTFRVPGDGGDPVVTVPGIVRLGLEAALFVAAVAALADAGQPRWATLLGGATLLHYALSYDRLLWLLRG